MSPITYAVPAGPDVPTAAQYIDVGPHLITAAGGQNYLPFLRVTAVLNPTLRRPAGAHAHQHGAPVRLRGQRVALGRGR
jgi:hypothetical protein